MLTLPLAITYLLLTYLHGLGITQAPRRSTARSQHGSWGLQKSQAIALVLGSRGFAPATGAVRTCQFPLHVNALNAVLASALSLFLQGW
jgi:hypothetical protein